MKRVLVTILVLVVTVSSLSGCESSDAKKTTTAGHSNVRQDTSKAELAPTSEEVDQKQSLEVAEEKETELEETKDPKSTKNKAYDIFCDNYVHFIYDCPLSQYVNRDFSCERAWTSFTPDKNDGFPEKMYFGIIDTEGTLIYAIDGDNVAEFLGSNYGGKRLYDGCFSNTPFVDGVSCFFLSERYPDTPDYIYSKSGFAIIDVDGNILYKPDNTDSEQYYLVGYHDDGTFLVAKNTASFNESSAVMYTIDRYGNQLTDPEEISIEKQKEAYFASAEYSTNIGYIENIIQPYYRSQIGLYENQVGYKDSEGNIVLKVEDLNLDIYKSHGFQIGDYRDGYIPIISTGKDANYYLQMYSIEGELLNTPVKLNCPTNQNSMLESHRAAVISSYKDYALVRDDGTFEIITPSGEIKYWGDDVSEMGWDAYLPDIISGGFIYRNNKYISLDGTNEIKKVYYTEDTILCDLSEEP